VKAAIVEFARSLGFDAVRVSSAANPDHSREFQEWLEQGFQGEMDYLRRNAFKRVDPQQVLPGAESIICLAVSYARPGDCAGGSNNEVPQAGVMARYAGYDDYHKIIGTKLQELTIEIGRLAGAETRSLWYVDTGPFLERDLAQRAGIGFVGKHNNLISRELGNWIFLAQIITTLKLNPDSSEKNHCGKCSRCLTACPTQAIVAPFRLDARRCISYLTIELKGSIPLEFRSAIGNRVYGCDDCLAACPWNRFAREGSLMKNFERKDLQTVDLLELLELDEEGFRRKFHGTPVQRTKRRGLLRNVCVALGNVGSVESLGPLERRLHDKEELVREHAAWAIEVITGRKKDGDSADT